MYKSLGVMLGATMIEFIQSNVGVPIDVMKTDSKKPVRGAKDMPSIIVEPSAILPWAATEIEDGTLQYIRVSVYPAIEEDEIRTMEFVCQIIRLLHDADLDLKTCVVIDMRLESAIFRTISHTATRAGAGPKTGVAELTFAVFLVRD